jgi:hypothetical protein
MYSAYYYVASKPSVVYALLLLLMVGLLLAGVDPAEARARFKAH